LQKRKELTVDDIKKMIYKEIDKKQKQIDPEKHNMRIVEDNLIQLLTIPNFFIMKGIENIALKKLNHFRSYVTRSTYIGISRVYGECLTYIDSNYYKGRKSSKISYR